VCSPKRSWEAEKRSLDGARYLRDVQHADALLCRLVAHHSCAIIEAGERGLADVLRRGVRAGAVCAVQRADLVKVAGTHEPREKASAIALSRPPGGPKVTVMRVAC